MGGHDAPSNTMGVRPMPIAGRFVRENERMRGMTDAERAWRSQWLKDQELSHRDPAKVAELNKELLNPIRRFFKIPMNAFQRWLLPRVGHDNAYIIRYGVTGTTAIIAGIYIFAYYIKYNNNDWTKGYGWRLTQNRPMVLPGDPRYPLTSSRQTDDYGDFGFKSRKVLIDDR